MNWKITNLEIQKQGESFTDIVIKAHWQVEKDGVRYYDVCTLPAPEGDFVPLDQLTEAEVLEWIFANGVDKDFAEGKVEAKIEKLANPPVYYFTFEPTEPTDAIEPQYEEVVEEVVEEEPAEEPTEEPIEQPSEEEA